MNTIKLSGDEHVGFARVEAGVSGKLQAKLVHNGLKLGFGIPDAVADKVAPGMTIMVKFWPGDDDVLDVWLLKDIWSIMEAANHLTAKVEARDRRMASTVINQNKGLQMAGQHTKGDWRLVIDGTMTGRGPVIVVDDADCDGGVRELMEFETSEVRPNLDSGWKQEPDHDEIIANAKLVVKAPKMRELLDWLQTKACCSIEAHGRIKALLDEIDSTDQIARR